MNQPDLGKLLLRLTLGFLLLFHGISRLIHGIGPVEQQFAAHDLPAFMAWAVLIGELIAPMMLILGYQTRVAALLVLFHMLIAIVMVHSHAILRLSPHGGWALEQQAFFLMAAASVFFLGPGKHRMHS